MGAQVLPFDFVGVDNNVYLFQKKAGRQAMCCTFQMGLSFITAVSYQATVRIIIVHHLECWTILW